MLLHMQTHPQQTISLLSLGFFSRMAGRGRELIVGGVVGGAVGSDEGVDICIGVEYDDALGVDGGFAHQVFCKHGQNISKRDASRGLLTDGFPSPNIDTACLVKPQTLKFLSHNTAPVYKR